MCASVIPQYNKAEKSFSCGCLNYFIINFVKNDVWNVVIFNFFTLFIVIASGRSLDVPHFCWKIKDLQRVGEIHNRRTCEGQEKR